MMVLGTIVLSISLTSSKDDMNMLNVPVSPNDCEGRDDAMKMLGRVADAFDNPSLHKTDKELLFVVNVVKSRHLLPSLSSEGSISQDTTYGSNDSSSDSSYDEDVELVELGDVGVWEHTASYPYASRRARLQQPGSFSDRIFREDDGAYNVTNMLLTSSPLDRLDRLARMELKKTGWVERMDKWSVVEMGLQNAPLPRTPPKTPSRHAGFHVGENRQRSSSPLQPPAKTTSPKSDREASRSPLRTETGGGQSPGKRARDDMLCRQNGAIKPDTPTSMRSPALSQESESYMVDFFPPHNDASHTSPLTPIRASRFSRALVHPQTQQQAGGRLGQVVRNFVKKILPPSSPGGGASPDGTSHSRSSRTGNDKGSPWTRICQAEMTPRSDVSGESAWTFASAGMWGLDYQAGLWH